MGLTAKQREQRKGSGNVKTNKGNHPIWTAERKQTEKERAEPPRDLWTAEGLLCHWDPGKIGEKRSRLRKLVTDKNLQICRLSKPWPDQWEECPPGPINVKLGKPKAKKKSRKHQEEIDILPTKENHSHCGVSLIRNHRSQRKWYIFQALREKNC